MSNINFNRRQFLQAALCSSVSLGSGVMPKLVPNANAAIAADAKVLVNLFLDGGPDMRHLVVPEYDPSAPANTFGRKYWANRMRSHNLSDTGANGLQTPLQRWNDDYFHITVGGSNWNGSLVDIGNTNTGITFGIWREAGWLIDMFLSGHVAMVFNAVGGTNRAHDLSSLMLEQGNLLSGLNDRDRSGWGGRLARSAGGNSIALTNSPSAFNFGPVGSAPNYDPDAIDNIDLISIENSRDIGLFDFNPSSNQHYDFDGKMARAAKSYYAGLRKEQVATAYLKALDHEAKVREFGDLIASRLENIVLPDEIQALYSNNIGSINPDPTDTQIPPDGRRVLRRTSFGRQIRNLYDLISIGDVYVQDQNGIDELRLGARTLSMNYGGWDSHGEQREIPAELATDPNNPFVYRGIESGLRDIFGGQLESLASPSDPNALHGGFSALWKHLPQADRDKMVLTIAGEFGRQIRDNGDAGTDHGKGNLMMVVCEGCRGGLYGEMFPQSEIVKYDEPPNRTPDIDPRTEIDHFLASVCDWVVPGSGVSVFPRMSPGYTGEAPILEIAGMFDNLFV